MIATSPSQVKKYSPRDGCPRTWALHYIAGIKEPFEHKDAAEFGGRLHKVSEDYLQHGIKPDPTDEAALRFMPGMRFLPAPGSGGAEAEYTATISQIAYGLIIDYIGPSASLPVYPDKVGRYDIADLAAEVEIARANAYPVVIDHKSTKTPRKKYKEKRQGLETREDFLTDEQAIIEAAVALITTKASHVLLLWLYYATEGDPYAEPRGCIVSRQEVSEAFAKWVHPFARQQAYLRTKAEGLDKPARVRLALSLPPVPQRCDKYKYRGPDPERQKQAPGCYAKSLCSDVSDSDRAFAALQTDEDKMAEIRDLLAELEAEEAQGGGPDVINGKRSVRKDVEADEDEEAPPPPPKKPAPAKPAKGATKAAPRDLMAEVEAIEPDPEPAPVPADKRPTKAPPAKPAPAKAEEGLTMRDLFATSALQTAAGILGPQAALEKIAVAAYALADEMLKART